MFVKCLVQEQNTQSRVQRANRVLLDTSVISYYNVISPRKTTNEQNSQKNSMDYTKNVDI